MSRRTVLTFSTGACLLGIYALYAAIVAPLFSPDQVETQGTTITEPSLPNPSPPKNQEMARRYLSSQPWTADAKYQVRTDESYIYAGEWDRVEPSGDVRFKPFAMIVTQKGEPDKEPIVLFSDSALLKFANRFEYSNPRPGRIIGGALEGDVQIEGEKGLLIVGRNFNFSEAALRVWSDHPLKFASGPHKGSGMGLELDLIPGPPTADKPGVSGIRVVRLRKDVVMDLAADQKELSPAAQNKPEQNQPERDAENEERDEKQEPAEPVHITCDGAFEFNVESHVATFNKNVRVVRPTGQDEVDRMENVETLTLVFEPAGETKPGEAKPAAAPPTAEADPKATAPAAKVGDALTFRRMRAEGQPVMLASQRSELTVAAKEVTYDGQTRIIVLRDAGQVKAVQKMNDLVSPEITIEHDPAGKVVQAVCRGAGRMDSYSEHPALLNERGELAMSAEWLKQLRKYPDSDSDLDVIEFEGQAVLRQPEKMLLEGEVIKIWITREGSTPEVVGPGRKSSSAVPKLGSKQSIQPKRLLALERVAFASPQLVGQTKRLEIWFEEGKLPPKLPASSPETKHRPETDMARETETNQQQSSARRLPTRPIAMNRRRGDPQAFAAVPDEPVSKRTAAQKGGTQKSQKPAVQKPIAQKPAPQKVTPERTPPRKNPPGKKPSILVAAEKPVVPVHITANLIRVRTIRDGDRTEVAEVWNEGTVRVTKANEGKTPPMQLQGDRLHLINRSENDQAVHVTGAPAYVQDRGMHIEGPEIFFDRGANTARVDGPGVLRLPVSNTPDGKALDRPQMLDVWWKEQMQFDGLTAKFFVDVRATMTDSKMKCQVMEVTMSQRVSFAGANPENQKTDVSLVHCKEGVEVFNHDYQGSVLNSVRQAQAWEFTLNQVTGDTTAAGPGALLVWRRGNGKSAGLSPSAEVQANRPLQAETVKWEYTRVDFAGQMQGNMRSRNSTFRERVRVVYGPVEHTTAVVDPDDLPKDGGWLRSDMLQIKQHVDETTKLAHFELVGKGNAELEGRMFHAMADQVSFDESKGQYVLRSLGTRMATIWREKIIGGPSSRVDAQRLEFNPSTNNLKTHQTSGFDGLE